MQWMRTKRKKKREQRNASEGEMSRQEIRNGGVDMEKEDILVGMR